LGEPVLLDKIYDQDQLNEAVTVGINESSKVIFDLISAHIEDLILKRLMDFRENTLEPTAIKKRTLQQSAT
jgi:hypothetical protein